MHGFLPLLPFGNTEPPTLRFRDHLTFTLAFVNIVTATTDMSITLPGTRSYKILRHKEPNCLENGTNVLEILNNRWCAYNTSTWELREERPSLKWYISVILAAGGLSATSSRLPWYTWGVPGQPGVHKGILSRTKNVYPSIHDSPDWTHIKNSRAVVLKRTSQNLKLLPLGCGGGTCL